MDKTYTPRPPNKPNKGHSFVNRTFDQLGEWELKQVVKRAQLAQKGYRHEPLLKAAKLAGGFIGAGRLDEAMAVAALETIASDLDDFRDSQRVICDGIKYGVQHPIYEEKPPAAQVRHYPEVSPGEPTKTPRQPIVTSLAEQLATPGSLLRPDESQLERLTVAPCDTYPPEWDPVPTFAHPDEAIGPEPISILDRMRAKNPALDLLINTLDLELISINTLHPQP